MIISLPADKSPYRPVRSGKTFSGRGHGKGAVTHSFGGDKPVRQPADFRGLAPEDENLQAVVLAQVHMQGGDHRFVGLVLDFRQLVA